MNCSFVPGTLRVYADESVRHVTSASNHQTGDVNVQSSHRAHQMMASTCIISTRCHVMCLNVREYQASCSVSNAMHTVTRC